MGKVKVVRGGEFVLFWLMVECIGIIGGFFCVDFGENYVIKSWCGVNLLVWFWEYYFWSGLLECLGLLIGWWINWRLFLLNGDRVKKVKCYFLI